MPVKRSTLLEWKRIYGKIYRIHLKDSDYFYRALKLSECEYVQSLINQENSSDLEDYILNTSVLYPDPSVLDKKPAGVVKCLIDAIIASAGFFTSESLEQTLVATQDAIQEANQNDFFQWKLIILQTLPGYTFEDLENMTPFDFFFLVRVCEQIHEKPLVQQVQPSPKGNPPDNDVPVRDVDAKNSGKLSTRQLQEIAAQDSAEQLRSEWKQIKKNKKKGG